MWQKLFLSIMKVLFVLCLVSCDSTPEGALSSEPTVNDIQKKIDKTKANIFKALKKYNSLVGPLKKDKCHELWGEATGRDTLTTDLMDRIESGLLRVEIPKGKEVYSYLSRVKNKNAVRAEMKEYIYEVMERMSTSDRSYYKLQAIFGSLNYQRHFAPGGFKGSKSLAKHSENYKNILKKFITKASSKEDAHIVFSNEALGEDKYPIDTYGTKIRKVKKVKEHNAVTYKKTHAPVVSDFGFDGKSFVKTEQDGFTFYASHFSSIKESERVAASNIFCADNLATIVEEMKTNGADMTKFAFVGDLNLYLFKEESDGKRILRDGVQGVLDAHQLVLFVPSGKVNKNIRPEIHDQWHKLDSSFKESDVHACFDSLMVLESYDASFDYADLAQNGLGALQDIFFPTSAPELSKIQKVEIVAEPFSSSFFMDHVPVRGRLASVVSGADADGTSNEAKQFIFDTPFVVHGKEFHLVHLRAMEENIYSVCGFIESLNL